MSKWQGFPSADELTEMDAALDALKRARPSARLLKAEDARVLNAYLAEFVEVLTRDAMHMRDELSLLRAQSSPSPLSPAPTAATQEGIVTPSPPPPLPAPRRALGRRLSFATPWRGTQAAAPAPVSDLSSDDAEFLEFWRTGTAAQAPAPEVSGFSWSSALPSSSLPPLSGSTEPTEPFSFSFSAPSRSSIGSGKRNRRRSNNQPPPPAAPGSTEPFSFDFSSSSSWPPAATAAPV
jgi:hypothetical protein